LDSRTCQNVFDEFLVLEFSEPAFGKVHFLTVACYMIQHRRYSDEGLRWIETKLRDYLENGILADKIRIQAAQEVSQVHRRWKVRRNHNDRKLPTISWSKTISDIKFSHGDAASYCREITDWCRLTLNEMQVWLDPSAA
jgi:hypothetical protein